MSRTRGRWSCSRSWSTTRSTPVRRQASPRRSAVQVEPGAITVVDNGPGMPPETVADILDFSSRVSSREAYVAPDRGAQGNALKTILAMPFVLDGAAGHVEICARGLCHRIEFTVDALRQAPVIRPSSRGARCKERHLDHGRLARIQLAQSWPRRKQRFLQIADDYTWLNPHLAPHRHLVRRALRRARDRSGVAQSGGRRTRPARTGTRPSTSSA